MEGNYAWEEKDLFGGLKGYFSDQKFFSYNEKKQLSKLLPCALNTTLEIKKEMGNRSQK